MLYICQNMTYFCNFLKLPVKHRLPPALTRLHHDGCAEEPTRFLVMGEATVGFVYKNYS